MVFSPKTRLFLRRLLIGAAWAANALLWASSLSVLLSPVHCKYLSVLGLAFPFFVVGVVVMLALVIVFAIRETWIPLLGLVLSFFSIRNYWPINFAMDPPAGAIKVLSYNVAGYMPKEKDKDGHNLIINYILNEQPDIACLQEAFAESTLCHDEVIGRLTKVMPYCDSVMVSTNVLFCFSRYPIIKKELVSASSMSPSTNGSAAFTLVRAPGDTILVVNCHLESMHLSPDDRKEYHAMVSDPENNSVEGPSRTIISKVATAAVERAKQASTTGAFVERNEGRKIILCGDFNDTPISYTHHRLVAAGLTDAYVSSGNGLGRSFNRDAIFVRIDNILCSPHFKPYGAHVDHSISVSDHYPIIAYLEEKED